MATPANKEPVSNPLGGIPAPGEVKVGAPLSDIHPDVVPQADTSVEAPNSEVQPAPAPQPEVTPAPTTTPSEAPKLDVGKEDAFDITEFLKHDPSLAVAPKVEPVQPPAPAPAPAPIAQPNADIRDYAPYETVFGKDNISDFKKMGNDAFNKLKPVIAKHVELEHAVKTKEAEITKLREGRVPDSYYENERAFLLTPDFQEAVAVANQADMIAGHWETQLNKIRAGEDTYQQLAYNNEGEIVLTQPIKVDASAESIALKAIIATQNQSAQAKAAIANLQQNFATKHKEAVGKLHEWESKAFAAFDKPELKPVVDDTVRGLLPPAFHANPLAKAFAKLFLVNNALMKRMQAGAPSAPVVQSKVPSSDTRLAGPQPNLGTQGAGSVKGAQANGDNVTFEDFEKRIDGI